MWTTEYGIKKLVLYITENVIDVPMHLDILSAVLWFVLIDSKILLLRKSRASVDQIFLFTNDIVASYLYQQQTNKNLISKRFMPRLMSVFKSRPISRKSKDNAEVELLTNVSDGKENNL